MGASRAAMRKMAKSRFWEQDDEQEDIALFKIAKDLDRRKHYNPCFNVKIMSQLMSCGHRFENGYNMHTGYGCECYECPIVCVICNKDVYFLDYENSVYASDAYIDYVSYMESIDCDCSVDYQCDDCYCRQNCRPGYHNHDIKK